MVWPTIAGSRANRCRQNRSLNTATGPRPPASSCSPKSRAPAAGRTPRASKKFAVTRSTVTHSRRSRSCSTAMIRPPAMTSVRPAARFIVRYSAWEKPAPSGASMATRRSAFAIGSFFRNRALTIENTAVLAPMPTASVRMTTSDSTGRRKQLRRPSLTSLRSPPRSCMSVTSDGGGPSSWTGFRSTDGGGTPRSSRAPAANTSAGRRAAALRQDEADELFIEVAKNGGTRRAIEQMPQQPLRQTRRLRRCRCRRHVRFMERATSLDNPASAASARVNAFFPAGSTR